MLILTRKPGESVIIEESVRITVLEVRGSQVKLGIQAPPEVRVNREEVLERQRAEANLPPLDIVPLPSAPQSNDGRERGFRTRTGRSADGSLRAEQPRTEHPTGRGRPTGTTGPTRMARPSGMTRPGSVRSSGSAPLSGWQPPSGWELPSDSAPPAETGRRYEGERHERSSGASRGWAARQPHSEPPGARRTGGRGSEEMRHLENEGWTRFDLNRDGNAQRQGRDPVRRDGHRPESHRFDSHRPDSSSIMRHRANEPNDPGLDPESDPDFAQGSMRRYRVPEARQRFGRRWARVTPPAESGDHRSQSVSNTPIDDEDLDQPRPDAARDQSPASESSPESEPRVKRAGGEAA